MINVQSKINCDCSCRVVKMLLGFVVTLLLLGFCASSSNDVLKEPKLSAVTVATERTDGFLRFERSAREFGVQVKVLGAGSEWLGGDVLKGPGGGQKVRLLREYLEQESGDENTIILFTDSYDVIFLASPADLLKKFLSTGAKILFGAEEFCWPDVSLKSKYPIVTDGNPYLNSGVFMGFYPQVLRMLTFANIKNSADDQLYYTKIYLNATAREELGIRLDHRSEVFQNLMGSESQVDLADSDDGWVAMSNTKYATTPLIVHGNGPSKLLLNKFGNFLAKSWSGAKGCAFCEERKIPLNDEDLPICLLAIFIEQPTPFFEEFLVSIEKLDYPKSRLHLYVHSGAEYHETLLDAFLERVGAQYASAKTVRADDKIEERDARQLAATRAANLGVSLFAVDSVARIRPDTLRHLLSLDIGIVSPLLVRPERAWSNFWGAVGPDGFYLRDDLYMDIVLHRMRGIWNVPFVSACYLVRAAVIAHHAKRPLFSRPNIDPDMAFCANMRDLGTFMYVDNEKDFGHLVEPDTFNTSLTHPDMYQLIENKLEWEARYLHSQYNNIFVPGQIPEQPCTDVYRFPFVSPLFCKELIEIVEGFGKWSDGSNSDSRLPTGYEAVPTRDIHMFQVGLDKVWKHILKEYVWPLQELVFTGYTPSDPSTTFMNFVVRYRPDEQPDLRPHHDSSTFTLNIALNTPVVDYEGGGCRFIRYNCSVKDSLPGWMLLHPGRLTHYHEGLRVTAGTRYIMITFADP